MYSLKDFWRLEEKPKVSLLENYIFEARINGGLSFSQLTEQQQSAVSLETIFKASALSGIKLPTTELLVGVVEQEFSKYLLSFGFKNLNEQELNTALQINMPNNFSLPSGISIEPIEPFGDAVSVSYLGKVLLNYQVLRTMVDRKLKNFIDGNGYNY